MRAISGVPNTADVQDTNVRQVLRWFDIFRWRKPIVVVQVPERLANQPYADVVATVRSLVDTFEIDVIVDGSPNSLPPELMTTNREVVMNIEPMSRDTLNSVPAFAPFLSFLKLHRLDDAVWKVVGGCPAKLLQVQQVYRKAEHLHDKEKIVFIKYALRAILSESQDFISGSRASTKALVEAWMKNQWKKVEKVEVEAKGFTLEYPNKVFRVTIENQVRFIVPATPAIDLLLSEKLAFTSGAIEVLTNKLF
jgi:hypothetical protein